MCIYSKCLRHQILDASPQARLFISGITHDFIARFKEIQSDQKSSLLFALLDQLICFQNAHRLVLRESFKFWFAYLPVKEQ